MRKLLTLCIVHQGDRVLLGLKKRGFGEGRWNGFGGKVQEGESLHDAALREMREETGVELQDMTELAIIDVEQKGSEDVLEVHLFKASRIIGEPTESEEMRPQWFTLDDIPFDQMWPDDRHWFPLMLADKPFDARFLYGGPYELLEHAIHPR